MVRCGLLPLSNLSAGLLLLLTQNLHAPRTQATTRCSLNTIQILVAIDALLADPGYYSYSASGPDGVMSRYMKSSSAHNTALVNSEGQLSFAPGSRLMANTQAGTYQWRDDEETTSAEGTYTDGYGPDGAIKVRHRRQVTYHKRDDAFTLLDEFTGEGEAAIWLHWQVPGDADLSSTGESVAVRAGDRALVRVAFSGSLPLQITTRLVVEHLDE